MTTKTPKPRKPHGKPLAGPLGNPPPNPPGDPELAEPEKELLFPEANSTNRIRIQREDDFTKKVILHGYLGYDEATEARISELWGGGRYVACMVGPDERGSSVVKRKRDVTILGVYKRPGEIYGLQSSQPTATHPNATPTAPDLQGLMRAGVMSPREALDMATVNQLLEISKVRSETGIDWAAILGPLLAGIPMLLERLMVPKQDSDVLRILERMEARLSAPPQGPVTSSLTDISGAIGQLLDVRDRIKGTGDGDGEGEGKDSSLMKIGMELIQTLARAQQGQPGPSPAPAARIPGKVEVPTVAHDPGPPRPLWQQMLQTYRGQLVDAARRGRDPEFIAAVVMEYLPDDLEGVLREFLARPDHAAVATQEIPDLLEFQTWNTKFWVALKAAMDPEPDPE